MARRIDRRQTLARIGAAGVAALGLRGAPAFADAPKEKLNLAVIGCGGQGFENLQAVAGENIVALCDVDERRAAKAFEQYPKAQRFRDYRRLLDALHGQLDAVVVCTPDHMHAPISRAALELG